MKSTYLKIAGGVVLLVASAGAMASNFACCGDLECCLRMLACCF